MAAVLWLIVPGFGAPHAAQKRAILRANLAQLVAGPWSRIHLDLYVYDDTELELTELATLEVRLHRLPGIVGQFLEHAWSAQRPLQYDHVLLLLDDVELQAGATCATARCDKWALAARALADWGYDALSPALTPDSPTACAYMRAAARPPDAPPAPPTIHTVNACEMFCYLLTPTGFEVWMAHYDAANPWLWGMDLILAKHMGLRVGLMQHLTARHHFVATGYGQHPEAPPAAGMHAYLAKYGETQQSLALLPALSSVVTCLTTPFPRALAVAATPPNPHPEDAYLALLRRALLQGERRQGRNGGTRALFGETLSFPAAAGFPLLTTKRVFWRGVVEELLWFLRGQTDAGILQRKGVHIWDGNSSRAFLDARGLGAYPEGECGPIYGWQWRRFGQPFAARPATAPSPALGDQLAGLLDELAATPHSRRALLCAWNPLQLDAGCLPPCHVLYQFSLTQDGLACHMYQRSADAFHGVPFNIASTALLTHLLAAALGVPVRGIRLSFGDLHIYDAHEAAVRQQLQRRPLPLPALALRPPAAPLQGTAAKLAWLESRELDDLPLQGYRCHGTLTAPMIA